MQKIAVFGLDLEDWYHLDYIKNYSYNEINYSMLDGLDNFIKIFEEYKIQSTLFVVGEISNKINKKLINLSNNGFEIASHSETHQRPLLISKNQFIEEIETSKKKLEDIIQKRIIGFRAPCFSLNREYLNILIEKDFKYDSSKIEFKNHPLYGNLDLHGFEEIHENIYKLNNFIEFGIPIYKSSFFKFPFSGGGYLRLLPKIYIKKILNRVNRRPQPLFFYIHPFELSDKKLIDVNLNFKNKFRFEVGRKTLQSKIKFIIEFLKKNNWQITTFEKLYNGIIN